jgi:hypothetical protein
LEPLRLTSPDNSAQERARHAAVEKERRRGPWRHKVLQEAHRISPELYRRIGEALCEPEPPRWALLELERIDRIRKAREERERLETARRQSSMLLPISTAA